MINIVTVTCERDLNQMILQSHSINTFVKTEVTHYVFIEDNSLSYNEWHSILSPHYNKDHKLIIVWGELKKNVFKNKGWIRQQLLKLKAITFVNDDYMILDSKNFFIKETNLNYGITEGSWKRDLTETMTNNFLNRFVDFTIGYLKKDKPIYLYASITPFFIKKETVTKLLNDCKIEELFLLSLNNDIPMSEFSLYSFYSNWNSEYDDKQICHIWWHDRLIDITKLEDIYNSTIDIVGLHRMAWNGDGNNLKIIADWAVSKGLDKKYVYPATVNLVWKPLDWVPNWFKNYLG